MAMTDFVNAQKSLSSWIPQDDPLKLIKSYQIKYWWQSFYDLYDSYKLNMHMLVRILSSKDCWRKVNSFHGVKLDGQVVGKKLLFAVRLSYPFAKKFRIACRYCLEDNIVDMMHESHRTRSFVDLCDLIAQSIKGGILRNDSLVHFWLHFLSERTKIFKMDDRNVFEYAFQCAIEMKQPWAMEFFWGKIKSLPENEMSNLRKHDIIMKYAVDIADECRTRPEIFEFIFSHIKPEKYSELLENDLHRNRCYRTVSALLNALCCNEFKALFDCLNPDQISVHLYCSWIQLLGLDSLSGKYLDTAVSVFMHMWEKTGFDEHRSVVHRELAVNENFHKNLLVPLISKGYIELVWIILDKASPEHIKRYMNSNNAENIRAMLKGINDQNALYKFLSYQAVVKIEK